MSDQDDRSGQDEAEEEETFFALGERDQLIEVKLRDVKRRECANVVGTNVWLIPGAFFIISDEQAAEVRRASARVLLPSARQWPWQQSQPDAERPAWTGGD